MKEILKCIACVLVMLVILTALVRKTLKDWERKSAEMTSTATVYRTEVWTARATRDDGPSAIQVNDYRFVLNGKHYTGSFDSEPNEVAIGDTETIRYFPSDPATSRLASKSSMYSDYVFPILLWLGPVGAIFFILADHREAFSDLRLAMKWRV